MKEKIELNGEAINLRKKFGKDSNSPIDIFSLIHNNDDLTIVFYPMSNRMSGICIRDVENKNIGINSNSTYGRQRFTIAHELYQTEKTWERALELQKDVRHTQNYLHCS